MLDEGNSNGNDMEDLQSIKSYNSIQDFQALVEAAGLTRRYRYRADGMSYSLLEKMLQCIFERRHIIIHQTPGNQRARKLAWAEITSIMSKQFPKETEDLGGYLRRKWDNLLQGTKKKIRMGYTTRESGWNEQNDLLMKFFAEFSTKDSNQTDENFRNSIYFLENISSANSSCDQNGNYSNQQNDQDSINSEIISPASCSSNDGTNETQMITPNDLIQKILALSNFYANTNSQQNQQFEESKASCNLQSLSYNQPSSSMLNQSFPSERNESLTDGSQMHSSQSVISQEINEQLLTEHRMRMNILKLQNHYWQLQLRLIHNQTGKIENDYQDTRTHEQDLKTSDMNNSSNNSTSSPANSFSQFAQNS